MMSVCPDRLYKLLDALSKQCIDNEMTIDYNKTKKITHFPHPNRNSPLYVQQSVGIILPVTNISLTLLQRLMRM